MKKERASDQNCSCSQLSLLLSIVTPLPTSFYRFPTSFYRFVIDIGGGEVCCVSGRGACGLLSSFFLHSTVNRHTRTFTFSGSDQSKEIEYDHLCGRSDMTNCGPNVSVRQVNCGQAYFRFRRCSQGRKQGITSGSNTPTTNMDTLVRNLLNVKDKHGDQPCKKLATTYCFHKLPLLNCPGWIQLVSKSVRMCKMFCALV